MAGTPLPFTDLLLTFSSCSVRLLTHCITLYKPDCNGRGVLSVFSQTFQTACCILMCHIPFSFVYNKTSDIGLTQNSGDSGLCFEIWFRKRKTQDTYTLQAVSRELKEAWTRDLERILWEQAVNNRGTNKHTHWLCSSTDCLEVVYVDTVQYHNPQFS